MKVLAVSPIMREPDGRARVFGRALASQLNMRWNYQLDFYNILGGDDYRTPGETISRKYHEAQDVFLAGKWDAFLCLESDIIVPPDALERLAALDAPIAYGLFVLRHPPCQWNPALKVEGREWTAISDTPDYARENFGKVIEVKGIGQACTLIRREVLETISIRYMKGTSCDWPLALDAQAAGITQVADLGVVCGHMSLLPSPTVLWPDPNEPNLIRTEIL